MNDKIKTVPVVGPTATAYGLASSEDNYGNQVRGRELTCASGEKVHLNLKEWSDLHRAIEQHAQTDVVPDGVVDLGEMKSPLQTRCHPTTTEKKSRPRD